MPSLRDLHTEANGIPNSSLISIKIEDEKVTEEMEMEMNRLEEIIIPSYRPFFPLGASSGKYRQNVEDVEYFYDSTTAKNKLPRKFCENKIKAIVHKYVDYMEMNQDCDPNKELPPFPKKKFYDEIVKLVEECLDEHKQHIKVIKIYDILQTCLQKLPGCRELPFSIISYIPPHIAKSKTFYMKCDPEVVHEFWDSF